MIVYFRYLLYLICLVVGVGVLTPRLLGIMAPTRTVNINFYFEPNMDLEPESVMDFYHAFVAIHSGITDDARFEIAFTKYVKKYRQKMNVRSDAEDSFSCVLEVLSHSELWMPVGPPSIETRAKRYIFMAKVLIGEGATATFINENKGMLNNNLITQGLFYRNVPTEVIEMYAAAGADVNHLFELPYYPPGHHSFDLPYFWSGKQRPLTFVLQDDWGVSPVYEASPWTASGYDEWLELVRVLIQSGADVNLSNEPGF